jgi:hypothetical protein
MSTTISVSESLRFRSGAGKVKVRQEGHCRMCGRAAAELKDLCDRPDAIRLMTRHHLVPQEFFRVRPEWKHLRGCDANVVPLCRTCHDLVELPEWMGGRDHRRMLRKVMTQAEISFVIQVRGFDWLERRYPR